MLLRQQQFGPMQLTFGLVELSGSTALPQLTAPIDVKRKGYCDYVN